jgi:hypothetical protein
VSGRKGVTLLLESARKFAILARLVKERTRIADVGGWQQWVDTCSAIPGDISADW